VTPLRRTLYFYVVVCVTNGDARGISESSQRTCNKWFSISDPLKSPLYLAWLLR